MAKKIAKKKSKTIKRLKGFLPKNALVMMKTSKKAATPPVDGSAFSTLEEVYQSLEGCQRCGLCQGRTNIVRGEGNLKPEILFVGEAPGAKEDESGRPFVGRSGQLLTKMIEAMGVKREEVFIANVVKCRPPENRPPKPDEVEQCRPFLEAQIKMLKPKIVVALGKTAAANLLQTKEAIGELRGKMHSYQGTKLIVTFHPAYLLRNPPAKKDCWEDLQIAMKELGWKAPAKS
jgi:uracil-DNA glycosylase family 4